MAEVEIIGVVAVDDDTDEYTCQVVLEVDGQETTLNSVTYAEDVTPTLDDISPRYASVLGGDIVTFTGAGFDASATTTVNIDGVDCAV